MTKKHKYIYDGYGSANPGLVKNKHGGSVAQ